MCGNSACAPAVKKRAWMLREVAVDAATAIWPADGPPQRSAGNGHGNALRAIARLSINICARRAAHTRVGRQKLRIGDFASFAARRQRLRPFAPVRDRACRQTVDVGLALSCRRRRLALRRRLGKAAQLGFCAPGNARGRPRFGRLKHIREQLRAEHAAQTSGDRQRRETPDARRKAGAGLA
jgi:hypothetical protein